MPLYDYRCQSCGKVFTYLVGVVADNTDPHCPQCGSTELTRLVSKIRAHLSEDTRLEQMASSFESMDIPDHPSPRDLRRFVKRLSGAMGDEVDKEIFDEMEQALEEEVKKERGQRSWERDETIY